ncbi:MAG: ribosome maturation factor RimM [Desulfobacterota bacterium]|jgi:16S rRNA processing protein RimM|nr:ribosome maturation factor RimM [Thermodesulfobacteriota bacterium]
MPDLVEIARIKGPHGLKGRLHIVPLGSSFEGFQRYSSLFIGRTGAPVKLLSVEKKKGGFIIALEGLDHISQIEHLKGEVLCVCSDQLPALQEDEYFWRDIIGLKVLDGQGRELGVVTGMFPTGSNDVLEVGSEKRILIPFTRDVIREISVQEGRIIIDAALMDGLLD